MAQSFRIVNFRLVATLIIILLVGLALFYNLLIGELKEEIINLSRTVLSLHSKND